MSDEEYLKSFHQQRVKLTTFCATYEGKFYYCGPERILLIDGHDIIDVHPSQILKIRPAPSH